jgi:hypothetical protein
MLIFKNFHFISKNPLSRFPQGGKVIANTPSPLGESLPREAGVGKGVITIQNFTV